MTEQVDITEALRSLDINATAILVPTGWSIGPVTAYLFADEPVTLIDSGTASGRTVLVDALRSAELSPRDVARVIVTHAHGDHLGGAAWLQEESGCEVFLHQGDIDSIADPNWRENVQALLGPLGFDETTLQTFTDRPDRDLPDLTPLEDGAMFEVHGGTLRVEHRPGHSPGHVWITHESSDAMFVGDYVLASGPSTAGMSFDATYPTKRAPLFVQYTAGLRELHDRAAPVLFAGHGPPITDHAALIDRRLQKSERRTRRVLEVLASAGEVTATGLAQHLYKGHAVGSWDVMADVVGRLDLLVAEGRATAKLGEDGYWWVQAASP
jgi:glyoxylase-like metal-dependent hydrolase (beta-lactamase superfamily II)